MKRSKNFEIPKLKFRIVSFTLEKKDFFLEKLDMEQVLEQVRTLQMISFYCL